MRSCPESNEYLTSSWRKARQRFCFPAYLVPASHGQPPLWLCGMERPLKRLPVLDASGSAEYDRVVLGRIVVY